MNTDPDVCVLDACIKELRVDFLGRVKISLALTGAVSLAARFGSPYVTSNSLQVFITVVQAGTICFALYGLLLLRQNSKAFLRFQVPAMRAAALEQALSPRMWAELRAKVPATGAAALKVSHLVTMSSKVADKSNPDKAQ